jgi:transposase
MMHVGLSGDNMTRKRRPRYAPEFRLEAAQLVVDQNYSVREAAQAMSVRVSTMDKWARRLREERQGKAVSGTPLSTDQRKIRELEKLIKHLEMEKYILKKASALFMSDSMRGLR